MPIAQSPPCAKIKRPGHLTLEEASSVLHFSVPFFPPRKCEWCWWSGASCSPKIGAEGVMKNRASERRGWGSVLLLRGRRQVEMSPCPFQYQNTSSHFFNIGMGIRCPNSPPAPFQGWLHTFAPSTSWARQEGHALRKNKPSGSAFQLRFYLCSVLFASDP